MILEGIVVSKKFGEGSKSEHMAVYLSTAQGEYVLRQPGHNPFDDPDLKKLVGKEVIVAGEIEDYIFFASEVRVK